MKLVYIASPYTNGSQAVNVNRQIEVAHRLMNSGYAPVVPLLDHFLEIAHPRPYEDWLVKNLAILRKCDFVFRLEGASSGADIECEEATNLGIPVVYSMLQLESLSK
jgi:hypothetical protein